MKFHFHVHRLTNLFFFTFHLSQCHFSSEKRYREEWLQRTGPLNKKENNSLNKFRELLKSESWGGGLYETFFVSRVGGNKNRKVRKINNLLNVLNPRFEKIWKEDQPKLLGWQKILPKLATSNEIQEMLETLSIFFDRQIIREEIHIFLLLGIKNHCGGFADSEKRRFALECSGMTLNKKKGLLETLIHETAHLLFDRGNYQTMLKEKATKLGKDLGKKELLGRPLDVCINETVFTTVVNGCLGKKYFGRDFKKLATKHFSSGVKIETFYDWILHSCPQMLEETERYLKSQKKLDNRYLNKVGRLLRKINEGKLAI